MDLVPNLMRHKANSTPFTRSEEACPANTRCSDRIDVVFSCSLDTGGGGLGTSLGVCQRGLGNHEVGSVSRSCAVRGMQFKAALSLQC